MIAMIFWVVVAGVTAAIGTALDNQLLQGIGATMVLMTAMVC